MINHIAAIVKKPSRDCIYDILSHIDLKLCVDVGAAAGVYTSKLCSISDKHSKIIAFEPFPGNHEHFHRTFANSDCDVTLIKKAVSNTIGISKFVVDSVVLGNEPGWEKYAGYSSVGFLSSDPERDQVKLDKLNSSEKQILTVETTTIDDEFPDKVIDFMKIDVQGAEREVLLGSASALTEKRINVLYIEFSGEREIVDLLEKNNYQLYDSTYVIGSYVNDIKPFEDIGFECIKELNLSTGAKAYDMLLADRSVSPLDAISEVSKNKLGWIQTDLIAVNPNQLELFLEAAQKYNDNC